MASLSHRERAIYMAYLEERTESYYDMLETMTNLAKVEAVLTVDERNMLHGAYKKSIGRCKSSRKTLLSILEKESNIDKGILVRWHLHKVEAELTKICNGGLSIIHNYLLPRCSYNDPVQVLPLSFSTFYYEILGLIDRSCEIAKKALVEAFADLDVRQLTMEADKSSKNIIETIKDNVMRMEADKN